MPWSNKRKHISEYNDSCRAIEHTVNWRGPSQSPPAISPSLPDFLWVLESLPIVVLLLRCCCCASLRDIKPVIRTLAYKDMWDTVLKLTKFIGISQFKVSDRLRQCCAVFFWVIILLSIWGGHRKSEQKKITKKNSWITELSSKSRLNIDKTHHHCVSHYV